MTMTRESVSALGARRFRAAADQAYAWGVYSTALQAAALRGVTDPEHDLAVRSAGAYYRQAQAQFETARTDHEAALTAAQPRHSLRTA